MKANYHTHTKLCNHADGMPIDYVKKAIELGFEELGMSDHNPIPVEFLGQKKYLDNWCHRNMSYDVFENIYLPSIDEAIEKYGDQIKIYKGLECEYVPSSKEYYSKLKEKVDYLNLGLHFFCSGGEILNSYHQINYKNLKDYLSNAIAAMETGLFKIFVHPDLFMFEYRDEFGERVFDKHCEFTTRKIVECAIKNDVYLEINANGVSNTAKFGNGSKCWLYPEIEFWKIVKEYPQAKIIVGADAHAPSALDSPNIEAVKEMGLSIGLKILDFVEFDR